MAPKKKKYFKKLLSKTFSLYCECGFPFMMIALIFLIPYLMLENFFWENSNFIYHLMFNYSKGFFQCVNVILYIFVISFFLLYLIAIIKSIQYADKGREFKIWQAYYQGLFIFKDYLIVKSLNIIKVIAWFALFIIPGLVFAVLYSFSGYAFLIDGKKGNEALVFSKKIIKPHVVEFLDYVLFILAVLFAACYPLISIFDVCAFMFYRKGNSFLVEIFLSLQWIVLIAGLNFLFVFLYYLYQEMKKGIE